MTRSRFKFLIIMAAFFILGCNPEHAKPCVICEKPTQWTDTCKDGAIPVGKGFIWINFGVKQTQCIPCEKANTKAEKFVCFGKGKSNETN